MVDNQVCLGLSLPPETFRSVPALANTRGFHISPKPHEIKCDGRGAGGENGLWSHKTPDIAAFSLTLISTQTHHACSQAHYFTFFTGQIQ